MKFPERNSEVISKNVLKMKAGETVTGVFRGEIYTFRQHWQNNRPFTCIGAACPKCAAGDKASYRFRLNLVTKENAALVARIFEQGWKVQQQLEDLNKEYPLENHFVKITRAGNGTDTSYSIIPIKNSQINENAESQISKVQLNVLDPAAVVGAKDAVIATDGPETDEEVPF